MCGSVRDSDNIQIYYIYIDIILYRQIDIWTDREVNQIHVSVHVFNPGMVVRQSQGEYNVTKKVRGTCFWIDFWQAQCKALRTNNLVELINILFI